MNTARQANHHATSSNLTEMYPGIDHPGYDNTSDGDGSPNLPIGPLNALLGFELETYQIPLDQLLPPKKVPDGVMSTRKYKQIVSKIERELGWKPAETFETGIRKTVKWYLDNLDWVAKVQSGAYREWVAKQYQGATA